MTRGYFFSLDGLDGCGKSTQSVRLARWLREQGHTVVECRDPGGTSLGDQLRQILLHHRGDLAPVAEALLFMASRAQLLHEVIEPALRQGQTVVSDRYLLANVVYQGHAGGLDVSRLWDIGRFAAGGREPDLTLVLDVPLEVALARRGQVPDRLEARNRDFHERVRAGFRTEAARLGQRVVLIDATPSPDEVQERIRQEVARVLETGTRA